MIREFCINLLGGGGGWCPPPCGRHCSCCIPPPKKGFCSDHIHILWLKQDSFISFSPSFEVFALYDDIYDSSKLVLKHSPDVSSYKINISTMSTVIEICLFSYIKIDKMYIF